MSVNDYDILSDESLMECIQCHDHKAFSALVARYTRRFYAVAYRTCGDRCLAEDIVQDCFVKIWKAPEVWDASRGVKFTTWFYRVVLHRTYDYMRKSKNTHISDETDRLQDSRVGAFHELERKEQEGFIEQAVQSLPERQKTALNLCFYEGVSNREAADIMEVSVKGLESLLMRAKAGVRDVLIRRGIVEREGDGFDGS